MNNRVVLYGGIGNRVNQLVNGYAAFGQDFRIEWMINKHMPFEYKQIFEYFLPRSVYQYKEGDDGYLTEFVDYWGFTTPEMPYCSYWYPAHHPMGVELKHQKLIAIYRMVTGLLQASRDYNHYPMAAHYRGFGDAGAADVQEFVDRISEEWSKLNIRFGKLFVLADTKRSEIYIKLDKAGIPFTSCMSSEMNNDMDRNSLGQMRLFMSDYLTLNDSPVIVTSSSISSITDPARARGSKVIHLGKTRDDGNCFFVKNMPESFIQ
jgi:hypothetical protein